ncbi:MAG: ChaN family lipoprotein [Hyphomicrobiaceae bacterium]
MRRAFVAFVILCVTALPAASGQTWKSANLRDHPLVGKIYDTAKQEFISRDTLIDRLARVPYVLLGEIHDNADHHELQAAVILELVKRGRKPSVVMEMIKASQAKALSQLTTESRQEATPLPTDLARRTLKWDESGWPPFAIYEPVFAAALGEKLHMSAGEPYPETPEAVADILAKAPLGEAAGEALIAELKTSHCGVMPDAVLPKVAVAQRKRDIRLAVAMQAASKVDGEGAVLIAGNGHARRDRGVPHYLRHLAEKSVTVSFVEVTAGEASPAAGYEPATADFVWFTPQHEREDPCIELLKKFGKKKE